MYFCGHEECLYDDSEASRGKKKDDIEYSKNIDASMLFGIGNRYLNATLAKWNSSRQHALDVSNWIKNPKDMLVFVGAPNTGKTYVVVAIANYFLNSGKDVKYFNTRRFFEEIQKAIGNDKNQYEVIGNIARSEILIFDDIGASTNSEWQKEMILDLIDRRYSSNQPTIITTNFTQEILKNNLGERTSRRIHSEENLILGVSGDRS